MDGGMPQVMDRGMIQQMRESMSQQKDDTVTCCVVKPSYTVSSLEESPGYKAGPLQVDGPIHVQYWGPC